MLLGGLARIDRRAGVPRSALALLPASAPFVPGGATAPAGWASFGSDNAFGAPPMSSSMFTALEGPPAASMELMSATAPAGAFDASKESFE